MASETPEQREARLHQLSTTAQQRLASETPEQREARLYQLSTTAQQRLASETSEQRKARLHQLSIPRHSSHQNKQALSLSNCEVKEDKYSSDLEVVVRKSSEPRQSYSKFEVSPNMFDETDDHITIREIPRLVNYQRVSVKVKVIGEEDATAVKKGLMKQDYIIADRTGSCKIVTWEDNVGLLQVGNCY